jgi:hypothetical protein
VHHHRRFDVVVFDGRRRGRRLDGGRGLLFRGGNRGRRRRRHFRVFADDDLRAPYDVAAELMAPLQLLDDEAVLTFVGDGAALHGERGARIERQTEHRHALEAFLLQDPEELGAHEHDAGQQRLRRIAAARRLYPAVERLQGLDGSEENTLAVLFVLLRELGLDLLAEGLVLRGEGGDGRGDFGDAVLGKPSGLEERVRRRLTALASGGG